MKGSAGLLPECNRSGDGSSLSTHGTLLLVCHSSYGPTINAAGCSQTVQNYTRWVEVRVVQKRHSWLNASDSAHPHFSVKLSLFMCMLAACSGSPTQCLHFLVVYVLNRKLRYIADSDAVIFNTGCLVCHPLTD